MGQIGRLNNCLDKIESYMPAHEKTNTKISIATVGWHLDHSLKVINSVIITLQKSDPGSYKNNFTILGRMFFMLGFFPRGKAKAPKYVKPPEAILKDNLILQANLARTNIGSIPGLDENAYFKHPIFGNVNKAKVYRFLILHTEHHLKIVNDIIVK